MQNFFDRIQLNEKQIEAVTTIEGPLLVLAGAGTGKTRVLTARIANIIEKNQANPRDILAVTFTNKAAREMQHRINGFVSADISINSGTFHSISARILRNYAEQVGLTPNFTIIDAEDQIKIIKNLLEEQNIDKKEYPPKLLASIISRWKDSGITYEKLSNSDLKSDAYFTAKKIYPLYQEKLHSSDLCDFGDLLLYNTNIFLENNAILERLQDRFKYILVDEYQDTNSIQYLWMRLLTGERKNICCVGDDDQSIYSWRGAEIANILRFEKDFPGAKLIKLEQNYRSSSQILKIASSLISKNSNRHRKTLWTEASSGEPIKIVTCYNEKEEAKFISNHILNSLSNSNLPASDIAVLVRAGFQTRAFEEAFINSAIHYKIIGGPRFYERAEIKDIIAYIRLILNENDDVAFERIINVPKRAIGNQALLNIKNHAISKNISYLESLKDLVQNNGLRPKVRANAGEFIDLIQKYKDIVKTQQKNGEIVKNLVIDSGYKNMLKLEKTEESRARQDNINELIRAVGEYESIREFLEHVSLVMEKVGDSDETNLVNIMTIHSAKGLEFDTVFIPGMEEGLFPHQKSINEEGEKAIQEERRIAYVAITRAKRNLILLHTENRRLYNEFIQQIPSRFLSEIEGEIIRSSSTNFYSSINLRKFPAKSNIVNMTLKEESTRPGNKVLHEIFGKGIILKKFADNLEIFFNDHGVKTIKEDYVKIADK